MKYSNKQSTLHLSNLKNYQNLSFLSEVIDKLVLRQLLACFSSHDLLCPSQSAYCPRHSTETALLSVTNDVLPAVDSGDVSVLSLLGLSSAVNAVDRRIVLSLLGLSSAVNAIDRRIVLGLLGLSSAVNAIDRRILFHTLQSL